MLKKVMVILILLVVFGFAVFWGTSIWLSDLQSGQAEVFVGEGIYVGQIDSQSVEILLEGQPKVFTLGEGVNVEGVDQGMVVSFTYAEKNDRTTLLSLEILDYQGEIIEGQGIYSGQLDSHSVEIVVDDQPLAFALSDELSVEHLEDGLPVLFSYRQIGPRLLLLSIDIIADEEADQTRELIGEGTLVGQVDAQSVEILINRVFMLGEEVSVEGIESGSLVAFTYDESGPRAVLDSLRAVDEPLVGEKAHGIYVGQVDAQSVEIEYYRVFALSAGLNVEDIPDGSEVVFTYKVGVHRPLLISIDLR